MKTIENDNAFSAKKRRAKGAFFAAAEIFMAAVFAFAPACSGGNTTEQTDGTLDSGTQGDDGSSQNRYCDILTDIINDPYYDQVIADFVTTSSIYAENAESPIPYAFLEREGYDVDAIKNDELSCESVAYIIGNDTSKLYLSVKAETSEGYYGNYVLSYPLTEKEYEDFYMLHYNAYIEAAFFVQELDKQKSATVESHVNVDTETFTSLQNRVSYLSGQYISTEKIKIDVVSANADCEFTVNVRTFEYIKGMISKNRELRVMENHTYPGYYSYNSNILKMSRATFATDNVEEFKSNYQSITLFDSQGKTNQGSLILKSN